MLDLRRIVKNAARSALGAANRGGKPTIQKARTLWSARIADRGRVDNGLGRLALSGARDSEAKGEGLTAIEFWDYLRAAEPDSLAAEKGVARCARKIAAAIYSRTASADILKLEYPLDRKIQWWKADVLMQLGRPSEAARALDEIENAFGADAASFLQRAHLAIYAARFGEAADAADSALNHFKSLGVNRQFPSCLYVLADALCMLDRHREARDILCRYLRGKQAWTDSDFVALFSTARNLAELEDARAFLAPALAGKSRLGLLQKYSMALLQLGDTAKALEIARTRFLEATAFPEPQRPLRAPADGWSLGAEQALLDLKTDMDLGGFEFFLISGTLLGCIREGKLLKHDKDIDVGVPADTSVDQLRAHLQSTGRFRVKPVENDRVLRALHCNGTSVDLFWHWDEGGKIMHQGSMSKWWNTPFSLASHAFLGTDFKVPSDAALYLAENYSNWQTPLTDYDTSVDTPNMIVTDPIFLAWYRFTKLYDYYARGKAPQFRKLWGAMQASLAGDTEVVQRVTKLQEELSDV